MPENLYCVGCGYSVPLHEGDDLFVGDTEEEGEQWQCPQCGAAMLPLTPEQYAASQRGDPP